MKKNVQVIRGRNSTAESVLRVAAYCRVSTDAKDQINSFMAQIHYYYSFIRQSENMELVDVYADEGISGTGAVKREEFKRISKKTKINRGEVDRYLVTDNHPAIIDRETFRLVKREMVRRSSKRRTSGNAITENESTVENMLSVNGCSAISAAVPFGERHGQETGKRRPIGDA